MSYGMSQALQMAVFSRLTGDVTLTGLVGEAIFDAVPAGDVPSLYVALGPEKVRDASDATGQGAVHEFTVSIVTNRAGFSAAKAAAGAVSDALGTAPLALARGRVVAMRFYKAAAARVGTGNTRRIDLIFRARLSDD